MRPRSLKEAVERVGASGNPLGLDQGRGSDEYITLAEFLDEFYMAVQGLPGQPEPQDMIDEEPPILGRQPFDAYIGAVGEHLARRWGLSRIPSWVEDKRRFLREPYFSDDAQLTKPLLLRDSPSAFRRRLIFTEAEPLRRGRWPKNDRSKPACFQPRCDHES